MIRPAATPEDVTAPGVGWPPVSHDPVVAADPVGLAAAAASVPQLDGYRLVEPLGQGGMGTVWRAVQLSSGREVALKLIRGAFFNSPRTRARFDREIELLARLEHAHIARLYHSGVCRGTPFYSMELVEGVPLDRYVREHKLPADAILALVAAVARAVDYAHRRGVIHRDLKPSNILVDAEGTPRIVDFGLGRLLEGDGGAELSQDGAAAGTLQYMSPEQAAGDLARIDRGTDVYSVGVLLYELLTGRFPHGPCDSSYALQRAIVEEEPLRPRAASAGIDSELEAILLKALAKRPEDRYSTAEALADDLDRYRRGDPLQVRPLTLAYLLRKRIGRYRGPLQAAALLTALVLSGVGAAWWQIDAAQDAAERSRAFAERSRYASHVTLAAAEIGRQAVAKAAVLLDTAPAALRAWEWRYLRHVADGSRLTLDEPLRKLALSADGERLLGRRADGTVASWSTATGQPLGTLDVRETFGRILTIASGGGFVLAGRDHRLTVLTLDGQPVRTHETAAAPQTWAISPDGAWVATFDETGTLSLSGPGPEDRHALQLRDDHSSVSHLRVANSGVTAYLVAGASPLGYGVRVHTPASLSESVVRPPIPAAESALGLTPDGSAVAVVGDGGEIQLLSTEDGRERWSTPIGDDIHHLFIPPGGAEVWATTQAGIIWCSATTGAPAGRVYGLAPSSSLMVAGDPAGTRVVAGDADQVKVWRRADQSVTEFRFPVNEPATGAFWSTPTTLTVAGALGSIFDVGPGGVVVHYRRQGEIFHLAGFGTRTAAGNHLLATDDGRIGRSAAAGTMWLGRLGERGSGWRACVDPRGRWVLGWDAAGKLVRWDAATSHSEPLPGHTIDPAGIVTDGAGDRVLLVDHRSDTTLRLCHAASLGEIVAVDLKTPIRRLVLSGDGEVAVAVLADDRLVVVDDTGTVLSEVRGVADSLVLALDHGGTRLVVGDRALTIFDTLTGQPILTLPSRELSRFAAFSPDDSALAIVGQRTVTIWRAPY